jgi:hypothetical protein
MSWVKNEFLNAIGLIICCASFSGKIVSNYQKAAYGVTLGFQSRMARGEGLVFSNIDVGCRAGSYIYVGNTGTALEGVCWTKVSFPLNA